MNKLYRLLILSSVLFSLFSCDKEDNLSDDSVVTFEQRTKNELDVWIYENLTIPFNVEVKYKWDDGEVENKFHVTPPKIEKAKEFLEAYLNVWIKPYGDEAIAGGNPEFLLKYMPKQLVLVGSPQYNSDGTMTLGLAEGGKKVTIFDIDQFAEVYISDWDTPEQIATNKRNAIFAAFHTLHHEFAHIMHQTKFYPDEFKEICKGNYTGNWMDVSGGEAEVKGFVTPYSMLNENEDFVEIVAAMLDKVRYSNEPRLYNTQLKDDQGNLTLEEGEVYLSEWEAYLYSWGFVAEYDENWQAVWVQSLEAKEGYDKFADKVDIITTYYKEKWGVDLYSLQKRIETAVNGLNF
jgi:substrate import-associated zinc metallohydrolase lipoprotein